MSGSSSLQWGDIRWGDVDPTRDAEVRKRRRGIVLSANELCSIGRTVIVVPLWSGQTARPPLAIAIASSGKDGEAVCDQLRTVGLRAVLVL